MSVVSRKEDLGRHGPAMLALPNDRWRAFAVSLVTKAGRGSQVEALREAGLGLGSTPLNQARFAWQIANDDRMIAALAELSRKIIRVGAPEAASALLEVVRNPEHRDHVRAIGMMLDRSDPVETRQRIDVVHKTLDPDEEAIEELRALRALGTPRAKLLELFGGNGLARLEDLESSRAKVIEHEPAESPPVSEPLPAAPQPIAKNRTTDRP